MEQIILGIDAASTSTGVSILCGDNLIYNKLIQPPKNVKNPMERISYIQKELEILFKNYDINLVAIEDIGLSSALNLKVAKVNLLLIGACVALGNLHDCIILIMNPSEWRKVVGVYEEKTTRAELKREFQKQKSIERVNHFFNLGMEWKNDKEHESDLAESALIGLAAYIILYKGGGYNSNG